MTKVSFNVTTGMSEVQAQAISRSDKPLIVYIYNDDADEEARFSIEESSAFFDDKVAVGARLFDTVRIDMESARKDRVLKEHLGRENSLVFLRPDYKFAKAIQFKGTKIRSRSVFSAMCATMKLDYKNCVATTYKKMKTIQKARAKLSPDANKIAQMDDKILNEKSDKSRDKLVVKRDKMQDKLDSAYVTLDEKENALFTLNAKVDKNAKVKDCDES